MAGDDAEFHSALASLDEDQVAAERLCPPRHIRKLRRFAEFCERHDSPIVPDPYQGGPDGFEHVLDLVEDGSEGLLAHVRRVLGVA